MDPKTLVAGGGLEPPVSRSEPSILAAERSRYGWEGVNRTLEASFKNWRLATNRPPIERQRGADDRSSSSALPRADNQKPGLHHWWLRRSRAAPRFGVTGGN